MLISLKSGLNKRYKGWKIIVRVVEKFIIVNNILCLIVIRGDVKEESMIYFGLIYVSYCFVIFLNKLFKKWIYLFMSCIWYFNVLIMGWIWVCMKLICWWSCYNVYKMEKIV